MNALWSVLTCTFLAGSIPFRACLILKIIFRISFFLAGYPLFASIDWSESSLNPFSVFLSSVLIACILRVVFGFFEVLIETFYYSFFFSESPGENVEREENLVFDLANCYLLSLFLLSGGISYVYYDLWFSVSMIDGIDGFVPALSKVILELPSVFGKIALWAFPLFISFLFSKIVFLKIQETLKIQFDPALFKSVLFAFQAVILFLIVEKLPDIFHHFMDSFVAYIEVFHV